MDKDLYESFLWQIPPNTPEVRNPIPRDWGNQMSRHNVLKGLEQDTAVLFSRKMNPEIPRIKTQSQGNKGKQIEDRVTSSVFRPKVPLSEHQVSSNAQQHANAIPPVIDTQPNAFAGNSQISNRSIEQELDYPLEGYKPVLPLAKSKVKMNKRHYPIISWPGDIQPNTPGAKTQVSNDDGNLIFQSPSGNSGPLVQLPKPTPIFPKPYRMYGILERPNPVAHQQKWSLNISSFPNTIPAGITHILNMCSEDHNPAVVENITYFHNPMDEFDDITPYIPSIITFIDMALADPKSTVLVHCKQGINRSAAVVIVYLCRKFGWKAQNALAMLKSKKPDVWPCNSFLRKTDEWFQTEEEGEEDEGFLVAYRVGHGEEEEQEREERENPMMGFHRRLGEVFRMGMRDERHRLYDRYER